MLAITHRAGKRGQVTELPPKQPNPVQDELPTRQTALSRSVKKKSAVAESFKRLDWRYAPSYNRATACVLSKEERMQTKTIHTSDGDLSIYGHSFITIYLPRSKVQALVRAIRHGSDADSNDKDLLRRLIGKLTDHLESQACPEDGTTLQDGGSIKVAAPGGRPIGEPIDPQERTLFEFSRSDAWTLVRDCQRGRAADFDDEMDVQGRLVVMLESHLAIGADVDV